MKEENKLYIVWAGESINIVEGKYYAAYASRSFAMRSEHIWPTGPFNNYKKANKEARRLLCDDDTCNVLLRKNNKWWRPECGLDKDDTSLARITSDGFTWVETD